MRFLNIAILSSLIFSVPVLADQAPPHYAVTPLTKADMDLYLSVLRPASAYIVNAKGDDRAAIDYLKRNHGSPKMPEPPKAPDFNSQDMSPQNIAAMQKAMTDYQQKLAVYQKKASQPEHYLDRGMALSNYDDEIARQKHVQAQYDAVKEAIDGAMAQIEQTGADCGGGDCGDAHFTAAQIALQKKEIAVEKANVAFVRPYAAQIAKLRKPLDGIPFGR